MNLTHLSEVQGFKALLAWHSSEDIQAVRLTDDTEWLFVDGFKIDTKAYIVCPVHRDLLRRW